MATAIKKGNHLVANNKSEVHTKLSKAGKAMRAGIGRGSIVELTDDPWNTGRK
jgi:hypothetical protein